MIFHLTHDSSGYIFLGNQKKSTIEQFHISWKCEKIESTVEDDDADDDDEDEVGQEDEHAGDLADPADGSGLDLLPGIRLNHQTKACLNLPWPLLVQGSFFGRPQKRAFSHERRWRDPGSKKCGRGEC